MTVNETNLDEFIKDAGEKAFRTLRKEFYHLSNDDLHEVFQRSFLALCDNLSKNKYDNSKGGSLSTYYIAICKNQARKLLEERSKVVRIIEGYQIERKQMGDDEKSGEVPIEEFEGTRWQEDYDEEKIRRFLEDDGEEVNSSNIAILNKILPNIPYPCKDIVTLLFYDKLPLQEIADELGYSSSQCVRTTEQRCLERLRTKFNYERKRSHGTR